MKDRETTFGRRIYVKTAGAMAGIGALAGCTLLEDDDDDGDGGDDDGDGDTEDSDDGDDGEPETITIAATIPLTGNQSSLGEDMERGYRLGVRRIEESDVIDAEIDLLLEDDESDEGVVRERLQQMVSNNDVDMIWGSFSSLLVTAGSSFAEQNGIPFIGTAFAHAAPHVDQNYEWTYAAMPKSRDVASSTLGVLELIPEEERPTNVGLWELNSGWGEEQANAWEDTLGDAGFDIVYRETYSTGTQDFSTIISETQDEEVDILLTNPIPPDGITMINQMEENNFTPEVMMFVRAADPNDWWSALEDDGAFALMCPGWVPGLTGNGNEEMQDLYEDEYGEPEGEFLPVMVGASYNVTQVAEQALGAADSTEPAAIQDALQSETFDSVIGSFGFEENGLPAEGELPAPVGQWWDGDRRLVYPEADSDGAMDLEYPITPWDER